MILEMIGPPQRIGAYEVGREIGRGGMGVVYLARDQELGRDVAIKALPEHSIDDASRMERFLHEARLLAQVRSPHIGTIYHLERQQGRAFLILEFVEGETLAQRLLRGPVPLRQALGWARQLALGLEAAHARGIVHRDLKPGNIMITPADEVKVLDFGLAKLTDRPRAATADITAATATDTMAGEAVGTPGYMSPEQVRGGEIDHRTDIWAFGCVLYECLTGRRAFAARSAYDAASAVLRDEPDFSLLSHAVPQRIHDLLRRCLTKDLARRLRDIGDARLDIEDALSPPEQPIAPVQPLTNLPEDLTRFIGRRAEVKQVESLLALHRLVTIHGCGGGGKTRLAVQVARELRPDSPGGAWLIELAGVQDGAMLALTAASSLGVPDSATDRNAALAQFIGDDRTLLVLDNCEHLVDACAAFVSGLLRHCAGLRVLATSREPLHAPGEQCFLLDVMQLPPPNGRATANVATFDAVELFVERARQVRAGFTIDDHNAPAIAEICRRLEGIPLAIELAAARLHALAPAEILERLRGCLDLLSRGPRSRDGAADRHRTLRAAVDWSYDLLAPDEQALLRRLSVFRGGWTLDAAEAVAGDDARSVFDLLEALVEKSLVVREDRDGGRSRYRMLEIIREYADSRFAERSERDAAQRAHHGWCLALAERAEAELSAGREQQRWLAALAPEHENMRAALAWGMERASTEAAVSLALALLNFWYLRGHLTEGRRWFEAAKVRAAGLSQEVRARCHMGAGVLAWTQGEHAFARRDYEAGLALWSETGNQERAAAALTNLGMAILEADKNAALARRHLEESRRMYQSLGASAKIPMVDLNLAVICIAEGQLEEAQRLLASCRDSFAQRGDVHRLGFTFYNLGRVALRQGRRDEAFAHAKEASGIALRLGIDSLLAPTMALLGAALEQSGRTADAARLCAGALRIYERSLAARPEQDVSDICTDLLARARGALGDATLEQLSTCARAQTPAELLADFQLAAAEPPEGCDFANPR